ncbi:MAG: hypothetical protein IPO22_00735 [Anaerolineales bacterium]|nr:hypothetical protein [Anaerolineales bacterium]
MTTMIKNPYVGPRTFQKEEGHLYFGRDREARDLTALVASERLVLFYAQSGAGKSSLLNTRLIPDLEKNRYEVFPIGRVSSGSIGGNAVDNIYVYNLMRSLVQHEIDPALIANISLAQFLAGLNIDDNGYFYDGKPISELPMDESFTPWRRALIIDQFEEVFSTHLDAWEKRADFFRQLAQAMQDDPYLWVVLVMREDYIAALDPYAHILPSGLRTRYYMQRLSRESALKAMKNPVEKLRPYAAGVAEKLVENLASIKVQRPDGRLDVQPGQYVEPVQLQVVCYGLWENLSTAGAQITEKDLLEVGDIDQSLEKYYDGRLSAVATEKNISERLIREWFGKQLITSGGIRNMVLREENQVNGLADDIIQTLQGDLVRAEMRAGQMWYELSHDRLIEPVRNSNAKWFERHLKVFQRQTLLWLQQGRSDSLLLRDKELQEAEAEAKTLNLTQDEQSFLDACRVLRKRVLRDRVVSALIVIGLIVQVIVMIFLVISRNEVVREKEIALSAKREAEIQTTNAKNAEKEAKDAEERAMKQAELALAGSLAAQADSIKGSDHLLALLLGLEGYQRNEESLLTRTTLFHLLEFTPYTRLFGHNGSVGSVAISPDGRMIASSSCREYNNSQCKYGEIILSDANGQPVAKLDGDYGIVNSLAFHQYDNMLLLAAGGCVPVDDQNKGCIDNKGQITFWDVTDVREPEKIGDLGQEHRGLVKAIAFNHDGSILASGSFDTTIILWDLSDRSNPEMVGRPLQGHTSFVNSVAFSNDDGTLVSAGDDQNIIIWDVSRLPNVARIGNPITGHTAPVNSISFNADGKQFASASDDKTILLWNWNSTSFTLQNPKKLEGHSGYVKSIAFSPAGTLLASVGFDNKVILWNTITGIPQGVPLSAHTRVINAVAFGMETTEGSTDQQPYLITGGDDRVVIKWDLSTRPYQALSQPIVGNISLPMDPGLHAVRGNFEANATGQQIQLNGRNEALQGHTGTINSLSFSGEIDGKILLASASDDLTVILWDVTDVTTPNVFLKLDGFEDPVIVAYFEGGQLVTIEKGKNGESNGRAIRWNITPSNWLSLACSTVNLNLTPVEWEKYLPGLEYQKTCPSNP